jgi:hypothetical protein
MALKLSAIGRCAAYSVTLAAASIVEREIIVCPFRVTARHDRCVPGAKAKIFARR